MAYEAAVQRGRRWPSTPASGRRDNSHLYLKIRRQTETFNYGLLFNGLAALGALPDGELALSLAECQKHTN
jgi:hypothetical protein